MSQTGASLPHYRELVWAEWSRATVGPRGKVFVDGVLCPTECANGTRVWVCRHVDSRISFVFNKPDLLGDMQMVFMINPRVKRSRNPFHFCAAIAGIKRRERAKCHKGCRDE